MAIQGLSVENRFEAASNDVLDRFGISLSVGHDFDTYKSHVAEARPDHAVGNPFDPDVHHLDRSNAVWVVGRDRTGRIMHTQALRLLPTGADPLSDYFRRNFREFPPSGPDIDLRRSRYRAGPGAKRLRGRIVYSGETWVGGDPGQYRGTGLSGILGRYAFLVAMRHLQPDYVVGFMTKPVAYKGFCLRMGFMHAEPFALRWVLRNEPEPIECAMVYMSDDDMRFMLDLPSTEYASIAA